MTDLTDEFACEAGTGVDYSGSTPRINLCGAVPTRLYWLTRIHIQTALCEECAPALVAKGDVIPVDQ